MSRPAVVDRITWQQEIDRLRVEEKQHTRAGDRLAAARHRLPMVELNATILVVGADGPVTLIDTFEGRSQLIAYFHMWHDGHPVADQCEGCTMFNGQVRELGLLHSRDVTYATFCQGPFDVSDAYRRFMDGDVPWYSCEPSRDALMAGRGSFALICYLRDAERVFETYWTTGRGVETMSNSHALLDLTVYERKEHWQDSPNGWPKRWSVDGSQGRTQGRPIFQVSRISAGQSDELSTR